MPRFTHHWPRIKQWTLRLAEFGLVQVAVQALTALAGLLIVRNLSKSEYALFAITNTMQGTSNLLADLGIGMGLRSIGGRVCDNPQRFGQLLNAALTLRRWFALASLTVTVPIAAWMLWHNGASWYVTTGLCLILIAGVIPLLASSVWSVSLQLHAQYRRIQKIDFANAMLRLAAIGGLCLFYLNALTASFVGAISNWFQMVLLRKGAVKHADTSEPPNKEDIQELKHLSAKVLPNGIFFCLQGQITVWIISIFGNASHVAEVSALGRIALLFAVINTTLNSVILPRFSRCQDPKLLLRRYFQILLGALLLSGCLLLAVALFSRQFLWLIGPKYSQLRPELLLMMLSTVASFIAGTMFSINVSKAWTWGVRLYIPATILTQIIVLMLLDVSTVRGVLLFGFWSVLPSILLNALMTWIGFRSLQHSSYA